MCREKTKSVRRNTFEFLFEFQSRLFSKEIFFISSFGYNSCNTYCHTTKLCTVVRHNRTNRCAEKKQNRFGGTLLNFYLNFKVFSFRSYYFLFLVSAITRVILIVTRRNFAQ